MALAFLASAGLAQAQAIWTSAGSTATVDESDTGIVEFINGEGRIKNTAPAGSTVVLRYNVVQLAGFSGTSGYAFRARFSDNGAGAHTRLELKRYRLGYAPTTIATVDSNNWTGQVGYQTQQTCSPIDWNFNDSVYYIEATLTKSAADGQAGVAAIQLIPTVCQG